MPRHTSPHTEAHIPPIVTYLRTIGAISILVGAASIMGTIFFLPSIICVYVGFGLWALDLWFEPINRKWKIYIAIIIMILIYFFTFQFVLISGPLIITGAGNYGYPDGADIGGIKWNKNCSAVRIYLANETGRDYNNMDITINIPGINIWAMGQITNIPNVSFIPVPGIIVGQVFIGTINPKTGEKKHVTPVIPSAVSSSTSKYRVRWPVFPRNTRMDLILEVSVKNSNSSSFGEKSLPKMIRIDTCYQDLGRERSLENKLYLHENTLYIPKLN